MLVTFTCPASADITMFGDVAIKLLEMMGRSSTVPSALFAEDVQPALTQLEAALAAAPPESQEAHQDEGGQDDEAEEDMHVGIRHRALPLTLLLEDAVKAQTYVIWDQSR